MVWTGFLTAVVIWRCIEGVGVGVGGGGVGLAITFWI